MDVAFRSVVLLSANERPGSPAAALLRHLFGVRFNLFATLPLDARWTSDTLVVMDCLALPPLGARYLATAVCTRTPCALLLINAVEEEYAELVRFPGLKGVLAAPVSSRQLMRGIGALQRGELCFSRRLMSRQMEELREHEDNGLPPGELTTREWRVLLLMAEGHSNATIAALLHLSPHTVKTHTQKIFRKIGAANRTQAAHWARQRLPRGGELPQEGANHVRTVA